MRTLAQWLTYQEQQHHSAVDLGLERIIRVWQGLCEKDFNCPVIVVGGTNGKGSTIHYLRTVYQQAGYMAGVYTSPHILRYNERVVIGDHEVSDEQLIDTFEVIEGARAGIPLTYFEYGTLAALWLFMCSEPDIVLLEVGMGGRLDAVNILAHDLAIVTNVSFDHMEWLGHDINSIAYEKAGIARKGKPLVYAEHDVPESIKDHCAKTGAQLVIGGRDYTLTESADKTLKWTHAAEKINGIPLPEIAGQHQVHNMAAAIYALYYFQNKLPVGAHDIREGLSKVRLAGRFQTIAYSPEVIADVAHNIAAIQDFAENVRQKNNAGRKIAVFAIQDTRNCRPIIRACSGIFDKWYVCSLQEGSGYSAQELCRILHDIFPGMEVEGKASVSSALIQAIRKADSVDAIFVFGSFYTVSEAMRELDV